MSESSMIEKIARAICAEMGRDPDEQESRCLPGSYQTDEGEPHWRGYREHARAAILAMRDPNIAMMEAAVDNAPGNCDFLTLKRAYQGMLDAALKPVGE